MDLYIRQAHLADLPHIYHICLKTGLSGLDATAAVSDKYIIGQYFAAPYLHHEIDLCFVVTNGLIPLGYILSAAQTTVFNDWMNKKWLPEIRNHYPLTLKPKSAFEKFMIDVIHRDCSFQPFLKKYPSHLHIDLLPAAQGKGFGRKLVHELKEKLKLKGSEGLHLSVGEKNTNAIKFYNRIGFSNLLNKSGAVFMVMEL